MTVQRDYPDFSNAGDTGENLIDAIQPISDGEGAGQSVFRRPSENLRSRTEIMREALRDLHYHRDARDYVVHSTGTITWNGTILGGGTGIVNNSNQIYLRPFLTPASSVKATLNVGTNGFNRITYNVAASAYASDGMNNVTIEHLNGGVGTTLTTTISEGPVKRILVVFDAANTAHGSAAVKASVDAAIVADTGTYGLATRITTTDNGVAGNTVDALAETRLEATADQEAHRINTGILDALTGTSPLAEGDSIAIWYRHVVEPSAGDLSDPKAGLPGGRWESNPDRGSDSVSGNLFITSDDPQKIPGALPLCKVVDDTLVFTDGTRVTKGATVSLGAATDVFLDDTNFAGANTVINNGGISNPLASPYLQTAMDDIDNRLAALRLATYTVTDGTASTGGDYQGANAIESAITALGGAGGTVFVRRGTYTLTGPTYTVPSNVTIVGEHRDLVTIGSAIIVTLSNRCRLEDVTLGAGCSLGVANGIVDVIVRRVSAPDAPGMDGTRMLVEDFTLTSTTTGVVFNTINADDSIFRGIYTDRVVGLQGSGNHYENIRAGVATGYLSTLPSISIGGTNNTYVNITAAPRDTDLTVANESVIRMSLATNCHVYGLYTDQTTSGLTAGRAALEVQDCVNCSINGARIVMGLGRPLIFTFFANASKGVTFSDCHFINDSADSADYIVSVNGAHDFDIHFVDCLFDVSEQFHGLVDLSSQAGGGQAYAHWTRCQFFGAAQTVYAGYFSISSFRDCTFTIKNPVDGGTRPLPGDNTGMLTPIWEFGVDAQQVGNRLYGCTFDFLDSEVEVTGSGQPDISIPLVRFGIAEAYDTRFVNINNHIDSNGTEAGLVDVTNKSVVDGADFVFTSTAPTQAGTPALSCLFNVANYTKIKNVYMDFDSDDIDAPDTMNFISLGASVQNLEVDNVHMKGMSGQLIEDIGGTFTITRCRFSNCVIGSTSKGLAVSGGMHVLQGADNEFINCRWYIQSNSNTGAFDNSGSYSHYLFQGCQWIQNVVMTASQFWTGSGGTVADFRFVGCLWRSNKATAIGFNTGFSFTRAVGVGNTQTNLGAGGTTAPSFDPSYNSW